VKVGDLVQKHGQEFFRLPDLGLIIEERLIKSSQRWFPHDYISYRVRWFACSIGSQAQVVGSATWTGSDPGDIEVVNEGW
jgi:hypothetical protein